MGTQKKFSPITERQIKEKGVQSLGNRPNRSNQYGKDGLSADALKLYFDNLATLIAGKINEFTGAISNGDFDEYIFVHTGNDDIATLKDLVSTITAGAFATGLLRVFDSASRSRTVFLQDMLDVISSDISRIKEKQFDDVRLSITSTEGSRPYLRIVFYDDNGRPVYQSNAALSVTTELIGTAAVTGDKIGYGAVESRHIAEKSINELHLGDGSVRSNAIEEYSVKNRHLEGMAVSEDKIAEDAIGSRHIKNGAVSIGKLGEDVLQKINSRDTAYANVSYNPTNGILKFTALNGGVREIDLPLELIAKSGYFDDREGEEAAVLVLSNGSELRIPMNSFAEKILSEIEEAKNSAAAAKESAKLAEAYSLEAEEAAQAFAEDVERIEDLAQSVRDEANAGFFDGENGKDGTSVSVASVSESTADGGDNVVVFSDGKILTVKNGRQGSAGRDGTNGRDGADGTNGKDGSDGISPVVSVLSLGSGNRITITDTTGEKSFDVMDGRDGIDGRDGADGNNGADGISPTVTILPIAGGNRISITDKSGTKAAEVMDGAKGDDGKSAYDLYVEQGGTLTLSQWLASLHASDPQFVDSVDDMTDQSKPYVNSADGMIYVYGEKQTVVKHNAYNPATAAFNKRINSSGVEVAYNGALLLPFESVDLVKGYNIEISGVTIVSNYGSDMVISLYDATQTAIASKALSTALYNYDNGVYTIQLERLVRSEWGITTSDVKFIRLKLGIAASAAISSADCSNLVVEFVPKSGSITEAGWVSTGLAYAPTDYEGRIVVLENVAVDHEERIEALEEGNETGVSIPSYWDSAVDACISTIKGLQVGRHCVTFPFFSDNHQRLGYAGALIAKVMKECHIPYCFYGGDSISNGYIESEAEMIEQDRLFDTMMKPVPNGRFCRTVGNHDGYWATSATDRHYYTREQVYELFLREEAISQLKHYGEDGTYYYVDDVASKVRFIVLNSNGGFGDTQRAWVQNTALNFTESGWSVVFISHAPVTNNFHATISDAQAMQTVVTNYINGSAANKADVVGWYSGHIHRDRIYQCDATGNTDEDDQTTVNLPWKTVTITSDHTTISYDDATKHTVANDNQSHAIDFVTINTDTKAVNMTRLGIGSNRSYTY